jgi:flagellar motility protein MotE (MotC chaperone)
MKTPPNPMRRLAGIAILSLLILSGLGRVVSASLGAETAEADPPVADLLCPPSEEVADLLRHVAARDAELDEREVAVSLREQDIRIAEQEVRAALAELRDARDALAARMAASDAASEEDVERLVSVYEGMKPKEAAALFEAMEARFAAGFLARMRAETASAIFSQMDPDAAYALSAIIAGRNADAAREQDG